VTTLLERIFGQSTRELPEAVQSHARLKKELSLDTPLEEAHFVAFDTELTGLDFKRDSVIALGAVALEGTRILPGKTFFSLVRPASSLNSESVVVHGITHSDLRGAPPPEEALEEFVTFIGNAVLIGHFVHIDLHFLDREMKKLWGLPLKNPAVDTKVIHDWLYENDSRFARHWRGMTLKGDLFTMARKYGIDVQRPHDALYDAFLAAQLFQRFAAFLPESGVGTLKDLIAIGKP
jgi:DNA polymerase-3 subunit epsilon